MKLSTLKYFVTVATENSFTKASEKLYISQPTLSRRIQELELELNIELFIRHSHGLKLSLAGEQFLLEVTKVLKSVDQLTHMFDPQSTADKTPQILKVGYLSNFNMGKMYELFELFKMACPETQFLLQQDTPMNLAAGLTNGHYDIVFNLLTYVQTNQTIDYTIFIKNNLQIALPIEHPLSSRKKITFSDLSQESFILLERQHSPVIVDYVINQGIKNGFNLKANAYVKDLDEGLSMVSVGNGLSFLYSGMNDGSLADKYHIKIIDLESTNSDQNIVAALNTTNNSSLLKTFFEFIKHNSYNL